MWTVIGALLILLLLILIWPHVIIR